MLRGVERAAVNNESTGSLAGEFRAFLTGSSWWQETMGRKGIYRRNYANLYTAVSTDFHLGVEKTKKGLWKYNKNTAENLELSRWVLTIMLTRHLKYIVNKDNINRAGQLCMIMLTCLDEFLLMWEKEKNTFVNITRKRRGSGTSSTTHSIDPLLETRGLSKTWFKWRDNKQFRFEKSVFGAESYPYGHKNHGKYVYLFFV